MLEMICKVVMSSMIKKRELILKNDYLVCPNIMKKLEKNEVSMYYLATWTRNSNYEIEHGPN